LHKKCVTVRNYWASLYTGRGVLEIHSRAMLTLK